MLHDVINFVAPKATYKTDSALPLKRLFESKSKKADSRIRNIREEELHEERIVQERINMEIVSQNGSNSRNHMVKNFNTLNYITHDCIIYVSYVG